MMPGSLSLVYCVRQSCVDTQAAIVHPQVLSAASVTPHTVADTVMIGLTLLLCPAMRPPKNNSLVSLAGVAEKHGLKNDSQIS